MNYIDLINNIDKKQLNNIVLLNVKEKYLYDIAMESLHRDYLNPDFIDLNFNRLDFEKLDKSIYISSIETLPFMDQNKIVLIENLKLERDKVKKFEDKFDFIQKSFTSFNESTLLILVYQGESLFSSGKFVKAVKKYGHVYDIDRLDSGQFRNFIIKHFAKNKIKLNNRGASFIADRLGYIGKESKVNLFDAVNELDKLVNNISSTNPTQEEIEETVIEHFQDNIFKFTDSLSNRNVKLALEIFERMKEDDAFMLFHMTLRHIKNLICVKDCVGKRFNKQTGMKYCMISSFEYDKDSGFARNFSVDELLKLHKLCFQLEKRSKTGENIETLMRRLIIAFARRK